MLNFFIFFWRGFVHFFLISPIFISIYLYIFKSWSITFIVTILLLSHISGHIIHLFSLFKFLFFLFFFLNSSSPISPHLLLHFLLHFPSLFTFLSPHYSLLYRYTSFILLFFLYFDSSYFYFILYKFDIISLIQFIFF